MSIYEFDEKLHERSIKEYAYEEGLAAGHAAGLSEGEFKKLITQVIKLLYSGKSKEDIFHLLVNNIGEDSDTVNLICDITERYAPDYDTDKIYKEITKSITL